MIKNNRTRVGVNKMRGFTLIELMITIAIIAILTTVAVTSYRSQIAKARRADVMVALQAGAQALERYYSTNGRYTTTAAGSALPAVYPTQSPQNGGALYSIGVDGTATTDRNQFKLKATRAGAMAGDPCGNFTIDHAGVLAIADQASGTSEADCIKR